MIFTEGPRGISPFPSGLGVARPRSEPRLLCCPGCLAWSLPGVLLGLTRTRGQTHEWIRARTRKWTQGGRELTQPAASVNATESERANLSVSLNNERELTGQTRADFRQFGATRTRA
jgi:hypothetical protein